MSDTLNQAVHEEHLRSIETLIEHYANAESLPAQVRDRAREMLIDTLACIFEGRGAAEVSALERSLGSNEAGSFRFPGGPLLSSWSGASVSAMASTWSEACEGLPYAHGRPGLAIVSAILALAVERQSTLDDVLRSLTVGYEVGARCGGWLRIRPGMHVDGNWPGLGVAVAVSSLLHLTAEQTIIALNIAACQLPESLYLPIKTGTNARNTYLPHSALLGLMSAFSAQAGLTAPRRALIEYAQIHSCDSGLPVPAYDHSFIEDAYFKPFASARHVHYGVEAALKVRQKLNESIGDINKIVLKIYPEAATYAGNRDPQAMITGQFSLTLGVASALRFGHMNPEIYTPSLFFDHELRKLEQLVEIVVDNQLTNSSVRRAELSVDTKSAKYVEKIEYLKGDPASPLSQQELADKFFRYSQHRVARISAQKFIDELLANKAGLKFADLWNLLF